MKLEVSVCAFFLGAVAPASENDQYCDAPPDLGKGSWSCTLSFIKGDEETFWYPGERCQISGQGCSGWVKCWKGKWHGRISRFCPKDCEGVPRDPSFGGNFKCENSACELIPWNGYKCSSSVKCNDKTGKWSGKSRCSFEISPEIKNNPPARPNGEWSCNGKCRFTCDNGKKAGTGKVGKTGWIFSTDWYVCCEDNEFEFSCKNGVVGKSSVCPNAQNTKTDLCERCDSGYDLVGSECVLGGTMTTTTTTTVTTPNHFTTTASTSSSAPTTTSSSAPTTTSSSAPTTTSTQKCSAGYRANGRGGCDPYKCVCPNGTPVVGSGFSNQVCNKNGRMRCESCDDGFELDCNKKRCICKPKE